MPNRFGNKLINNEILAENTGKKIQHVKNSRTAIIEPKKGLVNKQTGVPNETDLTINYCCDACRNSMFK